MTTKTSPAHDLRPNSHSQTSAHLFLLRFLSLGLFWILDHIPRSGRLLWGTIIVAGLGSQFGIWDFASAATVTGNLTDISIQPLNTRLLFTPTTNVLVTPSGLNAGPPKIVDTTNGAFSLMLEAGDYTISLPLIPWRRPFPISVFATNGAVNLTNLLGAPQSYTYTNNLNYSLKTIAADAAPDFLSAKLNVAGSLAKLLVTNSGAVSITLSNNNAAAPLHVNAGRVTAWSTNGASNLFDGTTALSAGSLATRAAISIEAFGSSSDPGLNGPAITFALKLGSTTICTQTKATTGASWHLRALLTVRSAGASGSVVGSMAAIQENGGPDLFPFASSTATVDTTVSQTLSLTASIDDFTGGEAVICDQLIARFE